MKFGKTSALIAALLERQRERAEAVYRSVIRAVKPVFAIGFPLLFRQ